MSEISFVMALADSLQFAEFLETELEAGFVLDESPVPRPKVLPSAAELHEAITARPWPPLVFVVSERWTRVPLVTAEVKTNDGRQFFGIRQRHGGPAFTWMWSRESEYGGRRFLTGGMLGDYSSYYLREGITETFDRPQAMVTAYKAIAALIQSTYARAKWRRTGRPGPWVGPFAQELSDRGVRLGPEDDWSL